MVLPRQALRGLYHKHNSRRTLKMGEVIKAMGYGNWKKHVRDRSEMIVDIVPK